MTLNMYVPSLCVCLCDCPSAPLPFHRARAVAWTVQAIRLMRAACENATDGATLTRYLRQASFNGVTGSVALQSGTNDRQFANLYLIQV